ncbi:hypothetical protein N500_0169 [Wolbachia pipientis wUni]|nr:hypothetical protein N500_0169 [Wolbachia pipientis wUni]
MKIGREEKLFAPSQRRRKTKLNQAQLQQIEEWIEENPNITIKEMRIRIQEKLRIKYQQIYSTPPYAKDEILIYYTKTSS